MRTVEDVSIPGLDVEAMRAVLEDAPVAVAVLYGSYARGEASARSDVDVAVGFEEDLPEDRTQARLALIRRLCSALGTDSVDVVPLSGASGLLLYGIRKDGILLLGSEAELDRFGEPEPPTSTHEERMAEFDEILADLERIV